MHQAHLSGLAHSSLFVDHTSPLKSALRKALSLIQFSIVHAFPNVALALPLATMQDQAC